MLTGRHAVTTSRPAAEVFELLADGARNPAWRINVIEAALLSGDGGLGSVWHQVVRGLTGRLLPMDYRVIAFERPRLYAYEYVEGPVRGGCEYVVGDEGMAAASVALSVRLRGRGVFAGMTGVLPRQMAAELNALDRLRGILEAGAGAG